MKKDVFVCITCLLSLTVSESWISLRSEQQSSSKEAYTPPQITLQCTGLFEIFGKLCSMNAVDMKEQLIDWVCDNRVDHANCMSIALNQSKQSLTEWLRKITMNDDFVPDELTLYCLARFTGHHALVYTNDFCWSTLLNQFRLSEDAMYERSKVKLVYVGHHMFVELKDIRVPKPTPPIPVQSSMSICKKPKSNKRNKKVTSRGDKPKRAKKSGEPIRPVTPPPPRPTRRNRRSVDYLKLNDGLDEPAIESPKQKRHKPYSPPPRAGPSVTRQTARKRKACQDNSEEMKLPDLVINTKSPDALNGGTLIDPLRRSAC